MTELACPGWLTIEGASALHILHTARSDQCLTPEGALLKTSTPQAPAVVVPQSERQTPQIHGLVQTIRVITADRIEEHREVLRRPLRLRCSSRGGRPATRDGL